MAYVPALLALLLTATSYVNAQDACSVRRDAACVAAVRSLLTNPSAFWYGTRYATDCPVGKVSSLCRNTKRSEKTLLSRIFGDGATDSSGLAFIIKVQYSPTLPADGSDRTYSGCGRIVDVPVKGPHDFVVDPLGKYVYPPYDLREEPLVTWQAEKNALYTVIMYDPAPFYVHALYVNVAGGILQKGDTVINYSGPGNPVDRDNPYIWLVFKQQKSVDASKIASARNNIYIKNLVSQLGLSTKSYGINIIMTNTDEYTAAFIRSVNFLNRCPVYYGKYLSSYIQKRGGLPSLPARLDLSVSVDVNFQAPPITYTACGKQYHQGRVNVTLDYRNTGDVPSVETRISPKVSLVPLDISGQPPSVTLKDKQYTLLMLDLTPELGKTKQDTYLHWMVVNIRGTDITSGDEVYDWKMPMTSNLNELFLFALFEQSKQVSTSKARTYDGNNCFRCRFRAGDFIRDNNLSLVGLRRITVVPDTYQQYLAAKTDTTNQVCKHSPPIIG